MRQHGTEAGAKWRGLVAEQEQSGQSVAAFCRERGVPASQIFSWKRRLREPRAPNPTTATDERGSTLVGLLVAHLCVEIRPPSGQACNLDWLASPGAPVVSEVEVATGPTPNTAGYPESFCRSSSWEYDPGEKTGSPMSFG